ncbi:sulfatase family protein [Roseibacillus persicicus]|uniref:sulfatase family protein n=1 Tax=Roseibacillus persicicus TaxID=454148 RepID=UPI00280E78CB|nr:arylsulfatase [Roseibacillus persicicus]MDQ8188691.1 arylsulfatase [Roseibacillus persicicus]
MKSLLTIAFLCPLLASAKPNILLILADDMGYGDVQALNPDSKIPTPHLDSLARDGMVFSDAHTPSSVCTPTRYALLTGRYCWRSPLKKGVLVPPKDKPLIENDRPTLASFLKKQGYRTNMVGKWHLGMGWALDENGQVDFQGKISDTPVEKGFDHWFGVAASLDMVPYTMIRDHEAVSQLTETQPNQPFPRYTRKGPKGPDFDPGDVLDDLAKEADLVIADSAKSKAPFFLYLPLTGPHKPVWPHERFVGSTELGPYGDFVHQVDHTVGLVLESLEKHGVADDTLVIYTSDNGSFMYRRKDSQQHHLANPGDQGYRPSDHQSNYHWRGTKADIYEGGHRVPFLVRWPEKAKAGSVSKKTITLTDIFATVAEVTESPLPEQAEDSYSFLNSLLGKEKASRPPVIHHSANGTFAIREGDWKLILSSGSGGRQRPLGKPFEQGYQLYDLHEDPQESNNLIEERPEIAKRLEKAFAKIARDHKTSQ